MSGYLIALTIVATKLNVEDMEEAAFQTLQRLGDLNGWEDEYRAELYTRIVDGLPAGPLTAFADVVRVVDDALAKTQRFNG